METGNHYASQDLKTQTIYSALRIGSKKFYHNPADKILTSVKYGLLTAKWIIILPANPKKPKKII